MMNQHSLGLNSLNDWWEACRWQTQAWVISQGSVRPAPFFSCKHCLSQVSLQTSIVLVGLIISSQVYSDLQQQKCKQWILISEPSVRCTARVGDDARCKQQPHPHDARRLPQAVSAESAEAVQLWHHPHWRGTRLNTRYVQHILGRISLLPSRLTIWIVLTVQLRQSGQL